ncbi:MAG: SGNH/GDSL hydrolase family protein [Acidobacteriota bacterium]
MSSSKAFPRIFYVLVPALACGSVLLVLELFLAVLLPVPFASERNMYFSPDPHTGFRLAPNSSGRFRGFVARVNSHGHRDAEVTLEKPAGTYRIMVLGDSFTMGANVRREEIYTEVLERQLNQRFEISFEVINTGVGGWSPFQYAQYFEHYGQPFDPDMILVGFFVGNDTYNNSRKPQDLHTAVAGRRVRRGSRDTPPFSTRAKIFAYDHSSLVRFFFNRRLFVIDDQRLRSRPEAGRDSGPFTEAYLKVQKRRLDRNHRRSPGKALRIDNAIEQLGRIKDFAASAAIPLTIVLIPDENQINAALFAELVPGADARASYDLSMPQKVLLPEMERAGLDLLDLLPDFLGHPRRLYMNDTHWTPAGHRLAAERILETLQPQIEHILASSSDNAS